MKRQEMLLFLKRFIAGAIMGLGAIVPGVSGGVLAVIMGLYEDMLDAAIHFFRTPRRNAFFLLPLGLGICFGVLAFSSVVAWSMSNYGDQVLFLFVGFVVGGIPSLLDKANKQGFRMRLLLPFAFGLAMILLPARLELLTPAIQSKGTISFNMGLTCGFILAVGTIVPGMSTSFILMYLGVYESILRAISTLDTFILLPVGIGFLVGALVIVKLVAYIFKRWQAYAYYAVLGLLAGSIILIFPPVRLDYSLLINVLLFILGNILAYRMGKIDY